MIEYRLVTGLPLSDARHLYEEAGWWDRTLPDSLLAEMFRGATAVVAAFDGEEVIGLGRLLSDGVSDGFLQDIVVRSARRGEGVGAKIVEKLVETARAKGIADLYLLAVPGKAPFYQKSGFVPLANYTAMKFNWNNEPDNAAAKNTATQTRSGEKRDHETIH
ncbi:MAG: GNAT family N-acetyltransferase [Victivallaceae bacterium]|nr:GNAT family N-acetyltransferase [Victivallaceae bacterium]